MKEEGNEETFKDSNMKIVCFIHFYPLNSNQKNTYKNLYILVV